VASELEMAIQEAFDLWRVRYDPADEDGPTLAKHVVDYLVEKGFVPEHNDGRDDVDHA
jgi:hypothetical protein